MEGDDVSANGSPIITVSGVGDPLPDVALPALDGSSHALAEWRGAKLLLFFWGSW